VPTEEQMDLVQVEVNEMRRRYMEQCMIAEWAEEQVSINTSIKARNATIKQQHDEIQINLQKYDKKLMGQVMVDMTSESRCMLMKLVKSDTKDPGDPDSALKADTIEEV
jgi:hypothetical protein